MPRAVLNLLEEMNGPLNATVDANRGIMIAMPRRREPLSKFAPLKVVRWGGAGRDSGE